MRTEESMNYEESTENKMEDIQKKIEKAEQKAFMEGYAYAIQVLQEGMPKRKSSQTIKC